MGFGYRVQDHLQRLVALAGRSASRALQQSSLEMTRAWPRSCATYFDRKGPIFLMLQSANMHDQVVAEIWVDNVMDDINSAILSK